MDRVNWGRPGPDLGFSAIEEKDAVLRKYKKLLHISKRLRNDNVSTLGNTRLAKKGCFTKSVQGRVGATAYVDDKSCFGSE